MKFLIRLFDPLSWPIWVKLSLGFLLAIGLPAFIVAIIALDRLVTAYDQNVMIYMSENGERQRQNIQNELNRAHITLANFTTNPTNTEQLIGLLLQNVQTNPPLSLSSPSDVQVANLIRTSLLNRNTTLFENVRLLNRDGIIISAAAVGNLMVFGTDDSESPAFQQAKSAIVVGDTETLTISRSPVSAIEMTAAILWRDGTPLGFLVATLDAERVFYEQMSFNDSNYPAFTYIVGGAERNIVFTPANTLLKATTSARDSEAVKQALGGNALTETYVTSNGEETIGHYGPIYDPTDSGKVVLALLSEVPANTQFEPLVNYFTRSRIFVLIVGPIALLFLLAALFNQVIAAPLVNVRRAIESMMRRDFDEPVVPSRRRDEIGSLKSAFIDMREQMRGQINVLESRIAAQSRDIATTQQISHFAASQRDMQILLDRVVDLIVERFSHIYHAQIFLIDDVREYAVLRASTGSAGRELLSRGHKLGVGSVSVIGRVTEQGRIVVARDTTASDVHRRNEFLPDTRAELAIPLRLGDIIIGALDVQSRRPDVFEPDEISVLQTMADQIAVAIDNARLYQDTLRIREEIQQANREATLQAWREFMYEQRYRELSVDAGIATQTDLSHLRRQAIQSGQIAIGKATSRGTIPIAVPIRLRGSTLGAVEWELPAGDLNESKLQLAQELANRMAFGLDSTRLYEESQRATERERIVNNIAAKLTPQTEIEDILETAVREIGEALHLPHVSIRLHGEGNGHSHPTS